MTEVPGLSTPAATAAAAGVASSSEPGFSSLGASPSQPARSAPLPSQQQAVTQEAAEDGWQQAQSRNGWKGGGGASAKDAADKERSR